MRVKKFEAKSMKEALQMVKNELGPDAVILAARDNRKFGLAGESSVEITAAVSESTLNRKKFTESRLTTTDRERFTQSDARTQRNMIDKMIDNRERQSRIAADDLAASERRRLHRITPVSYIDIQDEEDMPRARREAKARQTPNRPPISRNEIERAILARAEAEKLQARASQDRTLGRRARQTDSASSADSVIEESQPTAQARARIRAAAKEAFSNSFFDEDKRAARDARAPSAGGLAQAVARNRGEMVSPDAGTAASDLGRAPQARAAMNAASQTVAVDGGEVEIQTLRSEITRLQLALDGFQKVPQTFTNMHPGADFGVPYDFSFMFQKLTEAGVTVDNTVEILQAAQKEIDAVQAKKRPIIDAWVARFFLSQVQVNPHPFQGRVHLFVGGAGSGKTSTLVKIASQLVVREKKRVAILTTDAFKVGAVDQLKIYCQILNVPFAVIRNRKDWEWVLNQLGPMDHVLVDFPGLQLRDLDEIHLLKSLLPPDGVAAQSHFCVSATTKDGDAYEIAKRYRVAEYGDLIVTNLDQSVQHGIIYNVQRKTGKPLHSFGIGNRIPEDFELASKERVLDLIFKLTKFKKENR